MSLTLVANLLPMSLIPVASCHQCPLTLSANLTSNIGGKLTASVVDTDGKSATSVRDTHDKTAASVIDTSGKFTTGVVDLLIQVVHLDLRTQSSYICRVQSCVLRLPKY
jgi:hypothetical protein